MWSLLQFLPWARQPEPMPPAPRQVVSCGQCLLCVKTCPSDALHFVDRAWRLDLEHCHFCGDCAEICPNLLLARQSAPPTLKA